MKVIDLLNKIANGEEVPKKIKYEDKIYEWKEYDCGYQKKKKIDWVKKWGYVAELNRTYFYLDHCFNDLNDEVVIIEEDKKIEKLTEIQNGGFLELPDTHDIMNKINEIIEEINKLKDENK